MASPNVMNQNMTAYKRPLNCRCSYTTPVDVCVCGAVYQNELEDTIQKLQRENAELRAENEELQRAASVTYQEGLDDGHKDIIGLV